MLRTLRTRAPNALRHYVGTTNAVPDLKGIEHRWAKMKEGDQLDVLDYLNARQTHDWQHMSDAEKRALYHIYFGPWGPRDANQKKSTATVVIGGLGGGLLLISLGVAVYNYALDLERQEKLDKMGELLVQLQQKPVSESKGWWLWR